MASDQIEVALSDGLVAGLEEVKREVKAAKEALSEDRIRQIVREELAKWEKQQLTARRFGVSPHMETK